MSAASSSHSSVLTSTLLPFSLVLLVGCGKMDVEGVWTGSTQLDSNQVDVEFVLLDSDGMVSGSGQLSHSETIALSLTGSRIEDALALTIGSNGYADAGYDAQLSDDDTIVGTWTEPGLTFALTLVRER